MILVVATPDRVSEYLVRDANAIDPFIKQLCADRVPIIEVLTKSPGEPFARFYWDYPSSIH